MAGWRDGGLEGWRAGWREGWSDGGSEGLKVWSDGGLEGWFYEVVVSVSPPLALLSSAPPHPRPLLIHNNAPPDL